MYNKDRIIMGGEIKEASKFDNGGGYPFYIYLMPIAEDSATSYVLSVKMSFEKDYKDMPFTSNYWNPVTLNGVNVTSDALRKYRIFYGMEE